MSIINEHGMKDMNRLRQEIDMTAFRLFQLIEDCEGEMPLRIRLSLEKEEIIEGAEYRLDVDWQE